MRPPPASPTLCTPSAALCTPPATLSRWAELLAVKFNEYAEKLGLVGLPKISYMTCCYVKTKGSDRPAADEVAERYLFAERKIEGEFRKWNTNFGAVIRLTDDAMQELRERDEARGGDGGDGGDGGGGGDDVPTTLPSGKSPGPSRPGTKYPVRGQSLTSIIMSGPREGICRALLYSSDKSYH